MVRRRHDKYVTGEVVRAKEGRGTRVTAGLCSHGLTRQVLTEGKLAESEREGATWLCGHLGQSLHLGYNHCQAMVVKLQSSGYT